MTALPRPPAVSVIVPCYNAATTLAVTLASALAQTLADIEIIVVDDGSTDASLIVARQAAVIDSRVRILEQANAGVSAARNTGIRAARARLIALLDADDIWLPDHLETQSRCLQYSPRVGVAFSAVTFTDEHGRVTGTSHPKLRHINPRDLLVSNPATTCSTLVVRRDVFRDVGLFRTEINHSEDQEWLFRVTLSGWLLAGNSMPRVTHRTSPAGLGADLEGAERGFDLLIAEARKRAPVLVQREEARARATKLRQLAQRALRIGLPASTAQRLMLRSIMCCPALLLREPSATLTTLGASLMPRMVVKPFLHKAQFAPMEA